MNKKIDVLLGLQWGDEGKGKIVDVITPDYDIITRFQGGPNAGHTLVFNNIKHVLHIIPSGIFHKDKINVIGGGVVIDPVIFKKEIEGLLKYGIHPFENLLISKKAHLILPTHKILDSAYEDKSKSSEKIGSTLKGIGPAYTDKTARTGIRAGDIFSENFIEKYNKTKNHHLKILNAYNCSADLDEEEKIWFETINYLKENFRFIDSEIFFDHQINAGKNILAEGAQGTMLDIDFGSYPFVTSSNTTTAGVCTGTGIAPSRINEVIGICKAYCTRVGGGPFPTELNDSDGQKLRDNGNEYGSTTGRPRRCGWLDMVALKYSIMINGVTKLIITKADVLSGFEKIKIAVKYKINDEISDYMPYDISGDLNPQYIELEGWKSEISNCKTKQELPEQLIGFINFIEKETGVSVEYISVGPGRTQIIKMI